MIALIFQVVFIFFAMVVNVGLVINDKINLQNSVDLAAYYGAMKQAEVLNAMAQVNYQIRQIYKLMVWRLWALGDAGRNSQIMPYFLGGSGSPMDRAATWSDDYDKPLVCIYNQFWNDYRKLGQTVNACGNAHLHIPNLKPVTLQAAQLIPLFAFLQEFEQTSKSNANAFANQLKGAGSVNFLMTYKILYSYKRALISRKIAMQRLQNLLIVPAGGRDRDFLDLSGNSVATIVQRTLKNNLTRDNKAGSPEIEFHNSLQGMPFLVPIEVRVFLQYLDYNAGANFDSLTSTIQDFPVPPIDHTASSDSVQLIADALTAPDRNIYPPASAIAFAQLA